MVWVTSGSPSCSHVHRRPTRDIIFVFLEGHLRWPDNGDKEALWAPVPICTPEGGALMGWVGHPAHMAPKGCHYRSRFVFFSFGRSSTRLRLVTGSNGHPKGCPYAHPKGVHYNGCPKGHPYVHPEGVHIISRDLFIRACANARRAILAKIIAI